MSKMITLICLLLTFSLYAAPAKGSSKLNWMTNYEQAVNRAKTEKKPLLLFFTGSDWCGWCHKLENEALDTTDFADAVGDQFIFVMVDFPLKSPLEPKLTAQNKELQKRFDIKGYPTIVLLDDQQQLIGTTGYKPGGGKSYADHLKKMVGDFQSYKQKVSSLTKEPISQAELQSLYGKAQELFREDDAQRIVKMGIENNNSRFFLLERFKALAEDGEIHQSEAQGIRQKLLAQDPENKHKTHYEVAVIEFEAYSEEMEKENYAPEIAVAPLVAYIERFGEKDPENLWRLHMIIAQVYLDKNKLKDALKHAQASHATAPGGVQPQIQTFIQNIQISRN